MVPVMSYSKFLFMYGRIPRNSGYQNVRIPTRNLGNSFCAVNPKFIAFVLEVSGGGAFQVVPLKKTGKIEYFYGRINGHRGPVSDLKFNPFNDNVLASCSEDSTVKLWNISDSQGYAPVIEEIHNLEGHYTKVVSVEWSLTVENLLVSGDVDSKILLWDVSGGVCIREINVGKDAVCSMSFNWNCSLLAVTTKDQLLCIVDPRKEKIIASCVCHELKKANKVIYLRDKLLLTTGFSRSCYQQVKLWNEENLDSALTVIELDLSPGMLFPFYDRDLNLIFITGKGHSKVMFYEITDSQPCIRYLNEYCCGFSVHGAVAMCKRGLRREECELFRIYQIHSGSDIVDPISFTIPRKTEGFAKDLYPETAAPTPALTLKEWLSGVDRAPIMMLLNETADVTTHKPVMFKTLFEQKTENEAPKGRSVLVTSDRNNDLKFVFLNQTTRADYREIVTDKHTEAGSAMEEESKIIASEVSSAKVAGIKSEATVTTPSCQPAVASVAQSPKLEVDQCMQVGSLSVPGCACCCYKQGSFVNRKFACLQNGDESGISKRKKLFTLNGDNENSTMRKFDDFKQSWRENSRFAKRVLTAKSSSHVKRENEEPCSLAKCSDITSWPSLEFRNPVELKSPEYFDEYTWSKMQIEQPVTKTEADYKTEKLNRRVRYLLNVVERQAAELRDVKQRLTEIERRLQQKEETIQCLRNEIRWKSARITQLEDDLNAVVDSSQDEDEDNY
ncbi:Coronin-2A [Trichinella pseudospiralis]|uniref:Coronin n=2 Tax=Trichinella pseudospiralis TaxID=6337 RepID=A0A0V1IIF2_TRIPS|nr:Coronin-2A [Trichinella pseudospiralis]KRZ22510.1 Coronin-2A [Trichinella pseudospiralis]